MKGVLLLACGSALLAQQYVISTFAGGASPVCLLKCSLVRNQFPNLLLLQLGLEPFHKLVAGEGIQLNALASIVSRAPFMGASTSQKLDFFRFGAVQLEVLLRVTDVRHRLRLEFPTDYISQS